MARFMICLPKERRYLRMQKEAIFFDFEENSNAGTGKVGAARMAQSTLRMRS